MGIRFRKSKNIGPFRFTLSKSGISTSVGVKGFRVTKTASGRVRTTASIPGTGISYIKETSANKQKQTPKNHMLNTNNNQIQLNDLPRVHKKTSFYICLILGAFILLTGITDFFYGSMSSYDNSGITILWGIGLLVAAYFLKRRNDRERAEYNKAIEARKAEIQRLEGELEVKKAEVKSIKEQIRSERDAAKARQEEWERTHGRIITKVAGVTFDNEDGSSRQKILKAAMAEEACGTVDLELNEDEKGVVTIAVFYDGEQIGYIPKNRVADVDPIMDRITAGNLTVERFRPDEDDGEYIYRADLTLVYTKEPDDAT